VCWGGKRRRGRERTAGEGDLCGRLTGKEGRGKKEDLSGHPPKHPKKKNTVSTARGGKKKKD